MYIEDLLWINNELGVELPGNYHSEMIRYPFLDYLDTDKLALWDNPETIINTTKQYRKEKKWPHPWVCIGMHDSGPYAMNCESHEIVIAKEGNLDQIENKVSFSGSVKYIISQVHDGYSGKLPGLMPPKDTSFKWCNIYKDIPWQSVHENKHDSPFEFGRIWRVNQESGDRLSRRLHALGFHVIEIDGSKMQNDELFFKELEHAIGYGFVDDWLDLSNTLSKKLCSISKGGLMQTAIIWNHSDVTVFDNPYHFVDGVAFFETHDVFLDAGSSLSIFYLGSKKNGFTETVL